MSRTARSLPRISTLAVIALLLSLLSWLHLAAALAAVVVGVVALVRISVSKGMQYGRHLAAFAIAVGFLLSVILVAEKRLSLVWRTLPLSRKQPKSQDCVNNLKQIGLYLQLYVNKYGNGTDYPGTGQEFFRALRELPDKSRSITRGGADGLFVCKVRGTLPGPVACDYRGPRWPLSIGTAPSTPIACDRPENHGLRDSFNVLYFDGSVKAVVRDSAPYKEALYWTTDD